MYKNLTVNLNSRQTRLVVLFIGILLSSIAVFNIISSNKASAAACTPPATNYGTVTMSINVATAANYRVWSNMMSSSTATSSDSYLLEVDGSTCITVGDTSVPNTAWKWVDYQNGSISSKINVNLTAGNHIIKAIGREASVKLDKLIFASDTTCVPTGNGSNCTDPIITPPPPPPTQPPYDNKIIVRPNGSAYYVEGGRSHAIGTPSIRDCIAVRRGAGQWIRVTDAVVNAYTPSTIGYCNYEQEPGLNFIREDGDPTVWLVRSGGTKQHVGKLCVVDPYTTVLKKFRVWVVPPSETAGHSKTGDYFGTPTICAQLPG